MPNDNHYPAGAPEGKGGQFAPKNENGAVEGEERSEIFTLKEGFTMSDMFDELMSLTGDSFKQETKKQEIDPDKEEILQRLNKEFTRRLNKNEAKMIIENIKDANPKYLKILTNFWEKHPEVGFKVGPKLDTAYNWNSFFALANVEINAGLYTDVDWYAKGSSIFHESGHALNDTVGRNGQRRLWSETHVSPKYNMTLAEMVKNEIKACDYEEIQMKYRRQKSQAKANDLEYQRINNIKTQKNEKFTDAENLFKQIGRSETSDPQVFEKLRQEYFDAEHDFNIIRQSYKKGSEKFDLYEAPYNSALKNLVNYMQNYPKLYAAFENQEQAKAEFRKAKAQEKLYVQDVIEPPLAIIYGDLSDMFVASIGNEANINMGHSQNYFRQDHTRRGDEAFAEIFSAKATNPQSYELLQRVIPKTIEIFEEIIERIGRER